LGIKTDSGYEQNFTWMSGAPVKLLSGLFGGEGTHMWGENDDKIPIFVSLLNAML
jgi:hypothetical protein